MTRSPSRRVRTLVLRVALAVLATLALITPPAGAQSGELEIENVDATGFPLVRAVVSGPEIEGDPDGAFVVREDGEEVDADVVRLRSDQLNVVIALDVSGSMEGEPLAQAKAAIGEMLDALPEAVPVAIVSIGDSALVQSGFTTDRDATRSAVDGLIAAGGNRLYDGVRLGLTELERQGGSGGLVVLADGDDNGEGATLDETLASLEETSARTSFVALQTPDYTAQTFAQLGDAASGEVLEVDQASGFTQALQSVAAGLSTSYEIRYRSSSTDDDATLEVGLAGGGSTVSTDFDHTAKGVFVPDVATDTRTVSAGPLSGAVVPVVAALAVSAGLVILYFGLRNSEGAVERREERREGKQARKEERRRRMSGVQDALEGLSAQVLEVNNRGRTLDDRLDRAGLSVRANEFVVACGAVVLGSLVVGLLLFGFPFFVLGLLLPAIGIPLVLRILTNRRRKAFVTQLGDTLQLMAGSLTAGYGLGQTLDSVARETDAPTSEEFSRVVMETRLGRSLEDALDAMSKRIEAKDFDWVVDAIKIQASVGGDLAEIIDQVGETIRARTRIKRQVDALTAEGKISALVLFSLPLGLFGFIFATNKQYVEPLVSTGTGYAMLGLAATMLLVGGLWLKKLVNPEF